MKKGTELSLVILDKKTKEFLGTAGVDSLDTKTPELGVWVKKQLMAKRSAVRLLKS